MTDGGWQMADFGQLPSLIRADSFEAKKLSHPTKTVLTVFAVYPTSAIRPLPSSSQ